MKTKTKLGVLALTVITSVAMAGVAHAGIGRGTTGEVTIEIAGANWWRARGIPRVVRESNDTVQYIGCATTVLAGGARVDCRATDRYGTTRVCWSEDPVFRATALAIQPDDWVELQPWSPILGHTASECYTIMVSHASSWLPYAAGTAATSPGTDPSPGTLRGY